VTTSNATPANAAYLASKTGLAPAVALAWLQNEGQAVANPTNPLNIRYYGTNGQVANAGGFGVYNTTQAGLDHAAWLINNSAYYVGVRRAIATNNPTLEARAIELSPWAAGHYGGTHGPGSIVTALSGAVTTLAGSGPALGGWGNLISFPTGHTLTAADIQSIMTKLRAAGFFPAGPAGALADKQYNDLLMTFVGQSWTKATQDSMAKAAAVAATSQPGSQITGALGTGVKLAVGFAGLLVAVVGVWLYAKGAGSHQLQEAPVA
jgi:hypothetical protein